MDFLRFTFAQIRFYKKKPLLLIGLVSPSFNGNKKTISKMPTNAILGYNIGVMRA
jgi:hypothetical protein